MKDLKFSIFDLFSYSLPGGIAMIGFVFMTPKVNSLGELGSLIININVGLGIVLIFTAYIVGNAIDSIGSWVFYKVGIKIWGDTSDKNKKISSGEQRALVRNYSPENHFYIQQWKVVKTMSHNLSFSFLLLGLVLIIKLIMRDESREAEMIILMSLSLLFSIIFLNRAHIFDSWHYKDLSNIVQSLKLQERARKDSEDSKTS